MKWQLVFIFSSILLIGCNAQREAKLTKKKYQPIIKQQEHVSEYFVQIFEGNYKLAQAVIKDFRKRYPRTPIRSEATLSGDENSFSLQIGNCSTMEEAKALFNKFKENYPNSFILLCYRE